MIRRDPERPTTRVKHPGKPGAVDHARPAGWYFVHCTPDASPPARTSGCRTASRSGPSTVSRRHRSPPNGSRPTIPLVQSSRLPDGNWWNVFDDPTLTALIHLAYEENPNIRVAGARVLEARAGQAISVGNLLPAVAASDRGLQPRQPQLEHARHQSTGQIAAARFGAHWRSRTGCTAST